ncbi:receptor-binding cancer antigen expressed on SiSo cells [Drosophila novamexicana]|uniref:receptor-binding cancer antigen expressed on SiSo cells n=1 Tax=Drosophila novamexicana TaxID=47314 RepID=UPI0011E5E9F5|nr:receptor-binding cancer antigen expressed on SiSo cells [Drosophila novamexicana]
MVLQQIKMLLLGIITLCRRALCCFSRRRKLSHGGSDQLQAITIGDFPSTTKPAGTTTTGGGGKERDWNSWDDSPRTVEEHIEQYRQRMAQPPTPPKEEPEPDFFSELTPDIKPQPKYYLDDAAPKPAPTDFSRLKAHDMVPISVNADLEDWVDDNSGGWEELDTSQTKQMIREKRREMRHQRQPPAKAPQPSIGAQRISDLQRIA